ncbi:MAG TPA: hypothetical protein VMU51_24565 [Mycobacteriales bacterium]|nr:hypothetical protein [Mycobacteriales bacterium]
MLYLGNASSPAIRNAIQTGEIGQMCSPAEGRSPVNAPLWAADNGCYSTRGYPGDTAWLAWLGRHRAHARRCLFATAPDVVADAAATLARSAPHLPAIRGLGYPAALVAQDGLERLTVPWADFDVLFLGGTTTWKLGPAAASLTAEATARGKTVHMGRVNSAKRWRHAARIGCATVDGTHLTYAPDAGLADIRRWTYDTPATDTGHSWAEAPAA